MMLVDKMLYHISADSQSTKLELKPKVIFSLTPLKNSKSSKMLL